LFGLELLKKGVITRIGNGENTQILRDQWIPRETGLKITCLKKNTRKRWVNQLINQETVDWNVPLLKELFQDHDVEAILKIKIPSSNTQDCIAWHLEKNGIFTVKSAYKLAVRLSQQNRIEGSSSSGFDGDRNLWDNIWKSKVPPKVRVFGWRVATDSLATKKNKWRRTLEFNCTCDICGCDSEDAFHATVTCSKARALRQEMRKCWSLPPENKFRYTGRDWLQLLLDPLDDITRARVLLVLWRAWHLRNDVIHHKGDATIASSVIFLQSYLGETFNPPSVIHDEKGKQTCVANYTCRNTDGVDASNSLLQWSAPPPGWTKLNIDGSFCASNGTGGAGFVLRDSNGKVLVAACVQLHNCAEAEEAEASAALLGLLQMENLQDANMIIESDCYAVVKALLSNDQDRSKWCAVLEEAKACTRSFAACRVLHVRREANRVADALARLARTSGDFFFGEVPPAHVRELVNNDCKLMWSPDL
jgi:ribonuclease HI